jgi:type VI secretion system secreted protein Hcp
MAQTNIYLKLGDIKGESLDENHGEWIELDTFAWSVDNQANFAQGQGGQATQSKTHGISMTKTCDRSSVTLWQDCTTGKHIANGRIECLKLDGEKRVPYLKIDLTDVMVKGIKWSGVGSESVMKEDVELVFAEFKQQYLLQSDLGNSQGGVQFEYNIQTSRAVSHGT